MNYFLIPKYGLLGASYVTLCTYVLTSISFYFISNFYFKIRIDNVRVFSAIVAVPILYFLIYNYNIHYFSIKVLIFLLLIFLFYKFWLVDNEKKYIKTLFIKLKR
jgi:O-antigen/teichoic acid export membrane protein